MITTAHAKKLLERAIRAYDEESAGFLKQPGAAGIRCRQEFSVLIKEIDKNQSLVEALYFINQCYLNHGGENAKSRLVIRIRRILYFIFVNNIANRYDVDGDYDARSAAEEELQKQFGNIQFPSISGENTESAADAEDQPRRFTK